MKKVEAMELSPEKSNYIMETICQILSRDEKSEARINFSSYKIGQEKMCTFDIYIPSLNVEDHLNSGIPTCHSDVLYGQIFNDLIDNFLESETMGVTRFYSIHGMMGSSFFGVDVVNSQGSQVKLNFLSRGEKFFELVDSYNQKIELYQSQEIKRK